MNKKHWIKKVNRIPWVELEKKYVKKFLNNKGNIVQPLRMALDALLIQKKYGFSDEETIMQIQENPYLQPFI